MNLPIAAHLLVVAALLPSSALAQTTPTDPAAARILPNTGTIQATQETVQENRSTTLSSGTRRSSAPVSRNEAYNISRAVDGRVGVRVGNDVSFTVANRVGG